MNSQFKKGIVEMCVLMYINKKDTYGFEIVEYLDGYFELSVNTLYPILKRFVRDSYCTTYLVESPSGPARKYYKITPEGKDRLDLMVRMYKEFSVQVEDIMKENYEER